VRARFVHDSVVLTLPDTTIVMAHLVSADGGRYGAGGLVFWERGTSAFVQRGDSVIHRDCVRTDSD
jgi:membrane-bound inhibitor of C-type lysozyme